jgi:hypothetical protein
MALSMKMVASELLMCGLKNLPFVGTAVEVVEGVRARHEMLAHADRLAAAEDRLTRMERGLRDLVEKEIRTALENLSLPNLDGPTLDQEIRNIKEIRDQGWEPELFEGLLANSSHWKELQLHPENYGARILTGPEPVNRGSIQVLIDADTTRVLELPLFSFSRLLAQQAVGAPKAEVVSAQDIWAMPAKQLIEDPTLEGRINEFVTGNRSPNDPWPPPPDEVLRVLSRNPNTWMSPEDIRQALGLPRGLSRTHHLRPTLKKLVDRGLVEPKNEGGWWYRLKRS